MDVMSPWPIIGDSIPVNMVTVIFVIYDTCCLSSFDQDLGFFAFCFIAEAIMRHVKTSVLIDRPIVFLN